MVNTILIYPRQVVKDWLDLKPIVSPPDKPWALISINDTLEDPLINDKRFHNLPTVGCLKAYSVVFSDITAKEYERFDARTQSEVTLFTRKHAGEIIDFLKKLDEAEVLVVHCAAGISRSGAVGAFASRFLGINHREFYSKNFRIHPNYHILSLLNEVSGMDSRYMTFWEDSFKTNDRMRNLSSFRLKDL